MKITDKFVLFFTDKDMFSNFYKEDFEYKGHIFERSEQAFMWQKAIYFGDYEIANEILKSTHKHPKHAKALGRKVKNFDDKAWNKVRYSIMKDVVRHKVNQSQTIQTFIKQHKDKTFVEASPFDAIWGVKLSENNDKILDPSNWNGQNLLGKIYNELKMEVN